jgi:predicted metal-dependent phosphoesterase TrpH
MSPGELVNLALKRKVKALALTDHDTMEGTGEALRVGEQLGVEVVPGLEVSAVQEGVAMHILGYWPDHLNRDLAQALGHLQEGRERRNHRIVERLNQLGVSLCMADVEAVSGHGIVGRPHIARLLVLRGVVKNIHQAFDRFLKKDAVAYVPRFAYTVQESIGLIHQAGGLAVLAHPGQIDSSLPRLASIVETLVRYGLDGIEIYYPTHSTKFRKGLKQLAEKHKLCFTGGSDFHGDNRPGTGLAGGKNVFVPPHLLDTMKEKREQIF